MAFGLQVGYELLGQVDRDGKTDTDIPAAIAVDRGVNANDLALFVKQRPPELPGLMEASVWMKSSYGPAPLVRPLALPMPAVTVLPQPKRVANGHDPVTDAYIFGIAQSGDRQILLGLNLEHGQVGFGVAAEDRRLVFALVREIDHNLVAPSTT